MKKGQKIRAEKPKQYKLGWTEFYKLKFSITEDTLIPRPETELLVDEVLSLAASLRSFRNAKKEEKQSHSSTSSMNHEPTNKLTIIDIGTGSGIIAISIAKNLKDVGIVATDISPKALEIAKKNAKFHNININQIVFILNDLFEKFTVAPDIIVTNLPYIPTARLMHIDPMVTDWEPKTALDGGEDGFELYRKLLRQIKEKNLFPKYLLGEIDYTQADIVRSEVKNLFPDADIEIKNDLAKLNRYFVIDFAPNH